MVLISEVFCLVLSPLRRSKGSESQDGEKKKKGGFLNLIKRSTKSDKADKSDKSDKSEKNQATPAAPGTSSALAPATIPEEPSSPKVALKSPALEPRSRYRTNIPH